MSAEAKEQAAKSAAIDRQIAAEQEVQARTVKLLLLGAGESGKSTLVKQMKIIHGDGYNKEELKAYMPTICDNLVHSMRAVLEAMGILRINLGNQANRIHVKEVLSYGKPDPNGLSQTMFEAIGALWVDEGVQECYRRSNEYQLNDSAAYYFGHIARISAPGYIPNQQDVLRARVRTTGIIETSFKFKNMVFRMFDVGGQRSERKKWIQCFDDVTAIIFVTALSGYDMKIFEDLSTNRIHESRDLFNAICNNQFFTRTAMILFLNKTDLFSKKILTTPLNKYFPEYNGPEGEVEPAKAFILDIFKQCNKDAQKPIYHHFTCATDTNNIQVVFDVVSDIIIERNLAKIGLGH